MKKSHTKKRILLVVAAALIAEMTSPLLVGMADAAPQFTQAFVRLNHHTELVETGGTVCATPTNGGTEVFVDVTFPTQTTGTDFIVGSTAANWTVTTTNLPLVGGVTPTAWPGIGTATTVTGKTVRFPSTDLTDDTLYCFNFAEGTGAGNRTLRNASVGYQYDTSVQANITTYLTDGTTQVESTNWSTATIANDQITVTAIVPPLFRINFLAGNTDTFGNLDPGTVEASNGVPIQFQTNAKSGWIAWVKDSEQGLTSVSAGGSTIDTAGTVNGAPTQLVAGTEGYVLDVDINGGAVIDDGIPLCSGSNGVEIDAEYDATQPATHGGTFSADFQPIATCSGTPPSTTDGDIIELIEYATIAFSTPAATDYADIITVVGAGNF
jgi:hypothetical protein